MWKPCFALLFITHFVSDYTNWYYKLSVEEAESEYDFVIVGGGTTGNVIANRLTETPNIKVLVIEAGEEDAPNLMISIPVLALFTQMTSINWNYKTVTQNHSCKGMKNEQSAWPRGKVLGGSSSMNFMSYARGSSHDYDNWDKLGATEWSYKDVLPYFIRSENHFSNDNDTIKIDVGYHGDSGPLKTAASFSAPVRRYIFGAFESLGLKSIDHNGRDIHGFSDNQATVFNGVRQNSVTAFLRTVIDSRRAQLHILTQSHVRKILFNKTTDCQNKAVGVIYVRNGKEYRVKARKEIIVSGGAIGTPQLLMLSGLGPKAHIDQMNIPVIADLPGVGSNLQDHIMTPGCFKASNLPPRSVLNLFNPFHSFPAWLEYLFYGTGLLSCPGTLSSSIFIDSIKKNFTRLGLRPDLQFLVIQSPLPTNYAGDIILYNLNLKESYTNSLKRWSEHNDDVDFCDFIIYVGLLHPLSRGSVRLKSNNYLDHPYIDPNYLSHHVDVETMVEGFHVLEKLEETPPFKQINAKLNLHNCDCCKTDDDLTTPRSSMFYDCFVRHQTWTLYHPVGTAKMGPSTDEMSVVDPRLRVHKVTNLRVADASVIPELTSANTQAACYMIGEKAADMIKEDWNLL